MQTDEEKIWSLIQQKDIRAFESYYKDHYRSFFLMALRLLKDAGRAEEIVNDVFVGLWEGGERITISFSLKSYIYRAVINRSINALHKQQKEKQYLQELAARPEETFELRQIEEQELKIRLYKAIDQLPEQCGKVFRMSRFEGLKQREIADRLGISIKTVKNHITIALKRLSKLSGYFLVIGWIITGYISAIH